MQKNNNNKQRQKHLNKVMHTLLNCILTVLRLRWDWITLAEALFDLC